MMIMLMIRHRMLEHHRMMLDDVGCWMMSDVG